MKYQIAIALPDGSAGSVRRGLGWSYATAEQMARRWTNRDGFTWVTVEVEP